MPQLPSAPPSISNERGEPRFGTYSGSVPLVDLKTLSGPYALGAARRMVKHKKWLYTFVATRECIALCACADLSYTSNAFALVVDLTRSEVLLDTSVLGLPAPMVNVSDEPAEGLSVRYSSPTLRISKSRARGAERYSLHTRAGFPGRRTLNWKMDLLAAGAAPALTVVAPVGEDGVVNVTQKTGALLSFGTLEAKGRTFTLDGGVGGMDYTHGYLARHTAWRWAFACGRLKDGTPISLNLVEGFNETRADVNENALWVGSRLIPLGRARFQWNKQQPLDPWDVETDDGMVQLTFKPIGAHQESRDLKLVKSWFVQPVGLFEGLITVDGVAHPIERLAGVTEDQDILW